MNNVAGLIVQTISSIAEWVGFPYTWDGYFLFLLSTLVASGGRQMIWYRRQLLATGHRVSTLQQVQKSFISRANGPSSLSARALRVSEVVVRLLRLLMAELVEEKSMLVETE